MFMEKHQIPENEEQTNMLTISPKDLEKHRLIGCK